MRHDTRASSDIASRMRYEVFAKGNIPALTAEGVRLRSLGIASINLPNKQRSEDMLSQARAVRAGYDSASASAGAPAAPRLHVCVHWSVKNQYERSVDATFKKWCAFLSAAPAAQVDEVLLVSGGGAARKLDTIGCLERMSKARLTVPTGIRLGVAFNPFFPSKEARATEQKRLLRKLRTCLVDSVWLQLGSDAQLMDASLRWLRGPASVQTARWRLARVSGQRTSPPLPPSHTPATEPRQEFLLRGSVFLPSKQLLAQMSFRPWCGVFLSKHYLQSVDAADSTTREMVGLMANWSVEPLIETAVHDSKALARAAELVSLPMAQAKRQRPAKRTPVQSQNKVGMDEERADTGASSKQAPVEGVQVEGMPGPDDAQSALQRARQRRERAQQKLAALQQRTAPKAAVASKGTSSPGADAVEVCDGHASDKRTDASAGGAQEDARRGEAGSSDISTCQASSATGTTSEEPVPGWTCAHCTFFNTAPLALACEICGAVKPHVARQRRKEQRQLSWDLKHKERDTSAPACIAPPLEPLVPTKGPWAPGAVPAVVSAATGMTYEEATGEAAAARARAEARCNADALAHAAREGRRELERQGLTTAMLETEAAKVPRAGASSTSSANAGAEDIGSMDVAQRGTRPVIVWLRQDLRLADNPALDAAVRAAGGDGGGGIIPLFIHAPDEEGDWGIRGARTAWVAASLKLIDHDLRQRYGSRLITRYACNDGSKSGDDRSNCGGNMRKTSLDVLREVICETGASALYFNRRYEPHIVRRDQLLTAALRGRDLVPMPDATDCGLPLGAVSASTKSARRREQHGFAVESFNALLMREPVDVKLDEEKWHGHWGTLMPFYRACGQPGNVARPRPAPQRLRQPAVWPRCDGSLVHALRHELAPNTPHGKRDEWAARLLQHWRPGEAAALETMQSWLRSGLPAYEASRNRADKQVVSRLSPHLQLGELSPRTLHWAVRDAGLDYSKTKTFGRRLYWRDLAYFHLHCFPNQHERSIRSHYSETAWSGTEHELRCWQTGHTGYPMVDAAMRELWHTGWVQQNVRMVAGAFLTEWLNHDWRHGVAWFHHTLVDADLAINAMMWQNAGRSGIDQWNFSLDPAGGSQDPTGAYVRKWLPELAKVPTKYIHKPWAAPAAVLRGAGVVFGRPAFDVRGKSFGPLIGTAEGEHRGAQGARKSVSDHIVANLASGTYPTRCILDLVARRREMVNAVLTMRRSNQSNNDNGGYDLVTIPAGPQRGLRTRLFTKQEYRISRSGNQLPQSQHKRQRKGNQTSGTQAQVKSQRGKHGRVGRTMDDFFRSQGLER